MGQTEGTFRRRVAFPDKAYRTGACVPGSPPCFHYYSMHVRVTRVTFAISAARRQVSALLNSAWLFNSGLSLSLVVSVDSDFQTAKKATSRVSNRISAIDDSLSFGNLFSILPLRLILGSDGRFLQKPLHKPFARLCSCTFWFITLFNSNNCAFRLRIDLVWIQFNSISLFFLSFLLLILFFCLFWFHETMFNLVGKLIS